MADRLEMFGPTRGFFGDGRFNGTMQNVVGPTLVAMTMTFGLGGEIQTPTGLYCLYTCTFNVLSHTELNFCIHYFLFLFCVIDYSDDLSLFEHIKLLMLHCMNDRLNQHTDTAIHKYSTYGVLQ